jgi:hypothetical protein
MFMMLSPILSTAIPKITIKMNKTARLFSSTLRLAGMNKTEISPTRPVINTQKPTAFNASGERYIAGAQRSDDEQIYATANVTPKRSFRLAMTRGRKRRDKPLAGELKSFRSFAPNRRNSRGNACGALADA